ncbi:hypothetical protein DL93DRAFT_2172982 [Clavulina sp. PMI_390]|nr:hypothetical protein DL93DRAFT_2172982 [Clavulina sp. PMI_390]
MVDGTSELFTHWIVDLRRGKNLEINRNKRSRAKGRPLSVAIDSPMWTFALKNTRALTTGEPMSNWVITRAELEAIITGCRELVINLPSADATFSSSLVPIDQISSRGSNGGGNRRIRAAFTRLGSWKDENMGHVTSPCYFLYRDSPSRTDDGSSP